MRCSLTNLEADVTKQGEQVVLLLHGYGLGRSIFSDLVSGLPYEVWNVSLPGFDQTAKPERYDLDAIGELINSFIQHNIGKPVHIIGHSLGGYIALEAIEQQAEQFLSLGLMHSHPFGDSEDRKKERKQVVQFIEKYGNLIYTKEAFKKLFNTFPHPLYRELVDTYSTNDTEVLQGYAIAMAEREERINSLKKAPEVWLCSGKEDAIIPLELYSKIAAEINCGKWDVLANSGHMCMLEEAKEVKQLLQKFIG